MTSAQERLEFVLWISSLQNHADRPVKWSYVGLAAKFDDSTFFDPRASDQVGHFLEGLQHLSELPSFIALLCVIGHEFDTSRAFGGAKGCLAGYSHSELINWAAAAELRGDYSFRDQIIELLLPGDDFKEGVINPNRADGRSRQDFRLTLKAYHLHDEMTRGVITELDHVANWLRIHLAPPGK